MKAETTLTEHRNINVSFIYINSDGFRLIFPAFPSDIHYYTWLPVADSWLELGV